MKYRYAGNGAGVAGLPHEITDDEAQDLGVVELLRAAIANGNYVLVEEKKVKVKEITHGQ